MARQEHRQPATTFSEMAKELQRQRKVGIGEEKVEYSYSPDQFIEWTQNLFPVDYEHDLLEEYQRNQNIVLAVGGIMHEFFSQIPRDSIREQHQSTEAAHAYRTARIISDQFLAADPMVLSTALLHDAYSLLITAKEREAFRTRVWEDISIVAGEAFAHQLLINLSHFQGLDDQYANLAEITYEKFSEDFEVGIEQGFTPASHQALREKIIAESIMSNEEPRYFDLVEALRYTANGFDLHSPDYSTGNVDQVGNLATVLTMMAQAIDCNQFPTQNGRKQELKAALDVTVNLLPLAKVLDIPAAVRQLTEIGAEAFFPEQWEALNTTLKYMSEKKRHNKTGEAAYFDTQLRLSTYALRQEIQNAIQERGLQNKITEVPYEEYEARKILKLMGQWEGHLLDDYEITIISDKKSVGSIVNKALGAIRKGQFNGMRWTATSEDTFATGQEAQELMAEKTKDPLFWIDYLHHSHDPIRCKVILGNEAAQLFTLPSTHPDYLETIIKSYNFIYPDEKGVSTVPTVEEAILQEKDRKDITNRQVTYIQGVPFQKSEAQESRVSPVIRDGKIYFEDHYIFKLNETTGNMRNLAFEIHVESVAQSELNTIGNKEEDDSEITHLHLLYKLKEFLPAQYDPEEVRDLQQLILLQYAHVSFNGSIEGEVKPYGLMKAEERQSQFTA